MHILPPNNLCILPSHDMVKNETRASRVSASGHRIISPNIGLHLHQNQKWFRRKVYFPITHLLNAPNQNGLVLQFCISCLTQWICFMFTLAETYFRHREYVVVSTACKAIAPKMKLVKSVQRAIPGNERWSVGISTFKRYLKFAAKYPMVIPSMDHKFVIPLVLGWAIL